MQISRMQQKNQKKFFVIYIITFKFIAVNYAILQREYLWSAVNMLRNSARISDITKRGIFQLYLPQSGE